MTFDAIAKGVKVKLSDDGLTATKVEDASNAAVCGPYVLGPGVTIWDVTKRGLNSENSWIQFGILDKTENGDINTGFSDNNAWGVKTPSKSETDCLQRISALLDVWENMTFRCKFDGVKGTFNVDGVGNDYKAEITGLQGKKLHSFLNFTMNAMKSPFDLFCDQFFSCILIYNAIRKLVSSSDNFHN